MPRSMAFKQLLLIFGGTLPPMLYAAAADNAGSHDNELVDKGVSSAMPTSMFRMEAPDVLDGRSETGSLRVAAAANVAGRNGESSKGETISEVIVTAQKRAQDILDVPMSISVSGGDELLRKGIRSINDLSFASPGLSIREESPGKRTMYMRGVGNNNGADPLVSLYLDEMPLTAGQQRVGALSSANLFDIRTIMDLERVEVLRGPQGTLYGAGAVSGTVRFITNDPVLDKWTGSLGISASSTESGDASGELNFMANLPILQNTFGLRIAGYHGQQGGWIDVPSAGRENANNQNLTELRVKGLWQASDAMSARFTVNIHQNESDLGTSSSDRNYVFLPAVDPALVIPFQDHSYLYNLTVNYDFPFASIVSATSYKSRTLDTLYSIIANSTTSLPGYEDISSGHSTAKVFNQELRLQSLGTSAVSWTLGGFIENRKNSGVTDHQSLLFGFTSPYATDDLTETDSWALFGDTSYQLTDRLTIGAGIRYFEDDRYQLNRLNGANASAVFDSTTWRSYLSYKFKQNITAYTGVSTGFRSGGLNFTPRGQPLPPFEPENLITYDAGSKMRLFGGRLGLDISVYYSNYDDMIQRAFYTLPSAPGSAPIIASYQFNVGKARIRGVDTQLSWNPITRLSFNLSGTLNDGELTRVDSSASGSLVGDPIDYVPDYAYSLGAEYQLSWTDNIPGFVRVDFNRKDKVTVIDRGSFSGIQRSDTVSFLNARIGARWGGFSLDVFGNNLLNEDGATDPWVLYNLTTRPRPRTFGLDLGYDFN